MANNSIFSIDNLEDFSEKLNIDELYEKKRRHDLETLNLFNKILNRVHVRIKTTSRQKKDEQYCWFVVPEVIIGVPKYDQGACIAYLMDKLTTNGFNVRYIDPNTLFISWLHWVPSYVRTEIKKKTGVVVDEYGRRVVEEDTLEESEEVETRGQSGGSSNNSNNNNNKKNYTSIQTYKPSGNLIYDDDLLNKIENKFSK
jgi:hypothetical protein